MISKFCIPNDYLVKMDCSKTNKIFSKIIISTIYPHYKMILNFQFKFNLLYLKYSFVKTACICVCKFSILLCNLLKEVGFLTIQILI